MIDKILTLYKDQFGFQDFYSHLVYKVTQYPNNDSFLKGLKPEAKNFKEFCTNEGDIRVDLPVWFGNPESSKKIVIMGSEPRDTASHLNIEKVEFNGEKYVFATPFALEYSGGKYQRAFKDLTNSNDIFVYFTDVVKEYKVIGLDKEGKNQNDKNARNVFNQKANEYKEFLGRELDIIQPNILIGLGSKSYSKLNQIKFFKKKYENKIIEVTHPAAWGGAEKAKRDIEKILSDLKI